MCNPTISEAANVVGIIIITIDRTIKFPAN